MSDEEQRKSVKRVGVASQPGTVASPAAPAEAPNRRTVQGLVVGLILVTALAYSGVYRNDFVHYDDNVYVTENPQVARGLTWAGIVWACTTFHADNWHPLTWMSHMLDVQLFGMSAGAQHLTNLAWHIGNVLLLFTFLCSTTRRVWPSAWVAGMFALHPLHVESVAWIAERKDVLSTFFWLLTLSAYAGYVRRPGRMRYAGVVVLFLLGLLAKPMLVSLPFVLFLLDCWPLERLTLTRRAPWFTVHGTTVARLVLEKVPLVALALGSALVTLHAQRASMPRWWVADAATRWTNAAVSYARYLWEMVWPVDLAVLYLHPRRPLYLAAAASALLVVTLTAAAFAYGGRHKFVLVGWLWYLGTLVPVIGLVQVGDQSHADRYTYIPLIGIFVAIAWSLSALAERTPTLRKAIAIGGCAVLVMAGVQTAATVKNWRNDLTLYGQSVKVTPGNFVMQYGLGLTLYRHGDLEGAETALRQSLEVMPNDRWALALLAQVYFDQRRYQEAERYARAAIDVDPQLAQGQLLLASALVEMNRYAEAEPYCRKALQIDPTLAAAHAVLCTILEKQERLSDAVAACRNAVRLDPKLARADRTLADVYARQKDAVRAAEALRAAVELEPTAAAWSALAGLLVQAGRLDEAEHACRESIRLDSTAAGGYFHLAVTLAKLGRVGEALDAARMAQARAPGDEQIAGLVRRLEAARSGGGADH